MIKKRFFFLFIVASFLFLSPLDVKALTQGAFSPNNNTWYSDANLTNSCPAISGTHFRSQSFTASNYGWYTTRYYQNIPMSTTTRFDYLLIDLAEVNLGSDNYITYYNGTGSTATQEWTDQVNDVLTVYAVWKRSDNNEYLTTCYPLSFNNSDTYIYNLYCPVLTGATYLRGFRIETYIHHTISGGSTIQFGLSDYWNYHVADTGSDGITNAINNQTDSITQAQQGTTDAVEDNTQAIQDLQDNMNNSNTSSANSNASSWFSNFSTSSTGSISSIVTAPLRLINSITSTCQPVTLPFNFSLLNGLNNSSVPDKNVVLPCGTTLFWENQNFGNKMTNFRSFWNLLIGGPIIYGLLIALVNTVNNALNPLNDELVFLGSNIAHSQESKDSVDGYTGKHTKSGYEGRHAKK